MILDLGLIDKIKNAQVTQLAVHVKDDEFADIGIKRDSGKTSFGYVAKEKSGKHIFTLGEVIKLKDKRDSKSEFSVEISCIGKIDIRKIEPQDMLAQGFTDIFQYWLNWTAHHDKHMSKETIENHIDRMNVDYKNVERNWRLVLMDRPIERYLAWLLDVELINE